MTLLSIVNYSQLGSTNDEARRLAQGGAASGTLVRADSQTAGRGRHGRAWQSPPGNFFGSLILRTGQPLHSVATVALVAGIAVYDAVAVLTPPAVAESLTLKWPNDLLVQGSKLAGILVESLLSESGRLEAILIGIGVNLASAPAIVDYPTSSLAQLIGTAPAAGDFATGLGQGLLHWLGRWEGAGFAPLAPEWNLRAAAMIGCEVTSRAANSAPVTGRFLGVNPQGALLLQTHSGITAHHSGEWRFQSTL
ncbi:MAG: biotin--[acetyl-CoA-carboxylase] ligase [Alphaproteobacteria bacterium]|nr:biotin--[acetyl-CoA-carboxylase] ligase [Alphaproteobacteria bacterium]